MGPADSQLLKMPVLICLQRLPVIPHRWKDPTGIGLQTTCMWSMAGRHVCADCMLTSLHDAWLHACRHAYLPEGVQSLVVARLLFRGRPLGFILAQAPHS